MIELSLYQAIWAFIGLAVVIVLAGTVLARTGDQLADITGIGEALVGGVLLGGITSISGVLTSITAAWDGFADLSFSNAVGGIAAQTLFLAIADLTYRKSNLEHASASLPNIIQSVLLTLMLTFVIFVMTAPSLSFWAIHPASIGLFLIYLLGTRLVSRIKDEPMWQPIKTKETIGDIPQDVIKLNKKKIILLFTLSAFVVALAGYFVAKTGIIIAEKTDLEESFVGALFTAVVTSLPELVVTVMAVRQGALVMAVGNIIGGNTFDVLFLSFSDIAYREGSIYHSVGLDQFYLLALAILLNTILLLGLLHRKSWEWLNRAGRVLQSLSFLSSAI